jgi:hypothetical protein
VELKELVKQELKRKGADRGATSLCDEIFKWYDEGRGPQIEENIEVCIREIASPAEKEIKKMRGMAPRKAKKKGRRRR